MDQSKWQTRISDSRKNSSGYPPWELLDHLAVEEEPASSLEDARCWFRRFDSGWCFRGHRRADWFLISSLERERMLVTAEAADRILEAYQPFDSRVHANALREKFRRGAPTQGVDPLQWMQHYSTPTTLMDWTYNPYIALYFALEREPPKLIGQPDKGCALWAIDLSWLEQRSNEMVCKGQPLHAIVPEKPKQPNPRIIAQQGLFLRKVSKERTFTECLLGMLIQPPAAKRQVVSKLVLKREQRMTFLEELRRRDINHGSMFPGPESLDDLGRSLTISMRASLKAEADEYQRYLAEQMESRRHPS